MSKLILLYSMLKMPCMIKCEIVQKKESPFFANSRTFTSNHTIELAHAFKMKSSYYNFKKGKNIWVYMRILFFASITEST